MKPSAIWLGFRVGLWLCALPFRLHWYGLPGLLARLTPQGELVPSQRGLDVDSVAWVAGCVCRRRLFRSRLFPRLCLRQALALYAVLSRLSYPATIHVGVAKDGGVLHGHSWITVRGQPVGEPGAVEAFQILYAVGPTSGDEGSRHIQGSREAM